MTELRNWGAAVVATVRVELRRWSHRKVAVASAFVLPLAMAALVSVALGDAVGRFSTTVAVADLDGGPAAHAFFADALGSEAVRDVITVRHVSSAVDARELVDDGDADAALILPSGMSQSLGSGGGAGISVVRDDDQPIAGNLAALVAQEFEIQARATTLVARRTGRAPAGDWPLALAVSAPDGGRLDPPTHYGPAIGLFFVLVSMGFAASRLVADRQRGVIERLASAPVSRSSMLVGRAVAALAIGAVSLVTMLLAMQVLFGRSFGPLLPVSLVVVAALVALTGVAALLAAVARTPEQAQTMAGGVAFVFALASGSFAAPGVGANRTMFAALVPTTHALDAFATLTTDHSGVGSVATPVLVLFAFGLAGVALAPSLMRRIA